MFAAPFVAAMSEHADAVTRLARHPRLLSLMLSCDAEGWVKLWDLSTHQSLSTFRAHQNWVTGLQFLPYDLSCFMTSGLDGVVKLWQTPALGDQYTDIGVSRPSSEMLRAFRAPGGVRALSIAREHRRFVTGGDVIALWDLDHDSPTAQFSLPTQAAVHALSFCLTEPDLYLAAAQDCSLSLCDARAAQGGAHGVASRVMLDAKVNALQFNPRDPLCFLAASDDGSIREFDIRNLTRAKCVYLGHTNAVMDVDWSPTGLEFVSGSYDETMRLWARGGGRSRDVYHTHRMQRVLSVQYTQDARFVISGSLDGGVRVWKDRSDDRLAPANAQMERAEAYRSRLKSKYAAMPEVARILRHRHLPKYLRNATRRRTEHDMAQKRKTERQIAYTGDESLRVPERRRGIRGEEE